MNRQTAHTRLHVALPLIRPLRDIVAEYAIPSEAHCLGLVLAEMGEESTLDTYLQSDPDAKIFVWCHANFPYTISWDDDQPRKQACYIYWPNASAMLTGIRLGEISRIMIAEAGRPLVFPMPIEVILLARMDAQVWPLADQM